MKKLNIIRNFIVIAQFLLICGLCFVFYIFGGSDRNIFMPIGEPNLKITSEAVKDQMSPLIPNSSGDPVILRVDKVDFSLQATTQLKLFIIIMAVLTVGYFVLILEIFQRIVNDVRGNTPFNYRNISRVKTVGVLIALAPVLEYVMRNAFMFWINSRVTFHDMVLTSEANYGWSVFIIGLLIVVLGVAFEQGRKIQEENELTV